MASPTPQQQIMMSRKLLLAAVVFLIAAASFPGVGAWTGEIHGRVVCDVCGDSSIGPEDHVLEGAEVAVLCITKPGEVVNYKHSQMLKGCTLLQKPCLKATVGMHAWQDLSAASMNAATNWVLLAKG